MKMIDIRCKKCGADLKIEEHRSFCFCSYCGGKIAVNDFCRDSSEIRDADKPGADEKVRLAELELEKEKLNLRGTIIKVWIFIIVAIAVAAIEILLRDKDNPDSLGYLLLLIDFNAAMWPALFLFGNKGKKK